MKALLAWFNNTDVDIETSESAMIGNSIQHNIPIPTSYNMAIADPEYGQKWKEAIDVELRQLIENGTWHEDVPPENFNQITSKYVFSLKFKADGTLERFKARLVVF